MRLLPLPYTILSVLGALQLPTTAAAQDYAGTYTVSGAPGSTVTLVLQQAANGQLTGSMTGNGAEFRVEGLVEEGTAMGAITGAQGGVFFEASLAGDQLTLTLIEVGAGNMPDYSKVRTLVLQRGSGGGAAPAPGREPLAALGRVGEAPALQGQWLCRTSQGTAQLAFLSEHALVFNGEQTSFELAPGVIRVPGDWGPLEYRYQLSGDQLAVTGPDGGTMQCQRQTGAPAQGDALGGSGVALLQGQICAYSSSPDGGYSTLYKLFFDGQGRFLHGTESSYSGDVGSAYGLSNDPNAGQYQVTGNAKGAPIHLTFPDGSTATAYVYFVDDDNGRILEVQLNGRLYARALCQ